MKANTSRQYTIRNVPEHVDLILRRRAKESGKSFNQVALEALAAGAGDSPRPKRDFSEIFGTLPMDEAELIDAAIAAQHVIDPEIWK